MTREYKFYAPTQILVGTDTRMQIPEILKNKGYERICVVTGKHVSKTKPFRVFMEQMQQVYKECVIFDDTMPDPTVDSTNRAAGFLKKTKSEAVVAVGGGSCIDTAKAMCMLATNEGSIRDYLFGGSKMIAAAPLPLICVPTTAGSGSEVTASSVITDEENQIKLSVTHTLLLPQIAVIDPVMHMEMPSGITASTGMDALTHAIEAYTSLNANPLSDMYAENAIRMIGQSIRTAVWKPFDLEARTAMAQAALLGATAFVQAGLGAVHGIAQSMGGIAHTAHGVSNAVLLPHVMEVNLPGCIDKYAHIAELLNAAKTGMTQREKAQQAIEEIREINRDIRIPETIGQMGVKREMFSAITEGTMGYRLLAVNPVKIREEDVYYILENAMTGGNTDGNEI
ncbi:MAG: iron-containing alcohol dehydrogenase [Clostridiales bacterium]|nr:iron-containing alcohol dehydrogenase [Clostridiales bacterium]